MKTLIAIALFTIPVLLVPARASASTPADCQLLIVALSEQVAATTFLRGDKGVKTELQLQHQLSSASTEIDQGDFKTAIQYMDRFELDTNRAVDALVLSPEDGAALNTSADGVIACIQQIVP